MRAKFGASSNDRIPSTRAAIDDTHRAGVSHVFRRASAVSLVRRVDLRWETHLTNTTQSLSRIGKSFAGEWKNPRLISCSIISFRIISYRKRQGSSEKSFAGSGTAVLRATSVSTNVTMNSIKSPVSSTRTFANGGASAPTPIVRRPLPAACDRGSFCVCTDRSCRCRRSSPAIQPRRLASGSGRS